MFTSSSSPTTSPLPAHFGPILPTLWQKALMGYLAGLMAAVYPGPSLLLLAAMVWACVRKQELLLVLLCLGLGLIVGYQQNLTIPINWTGKHSIHLSGRIESVRTYPGHNLRLVIADAQDLKTGQPLPGKILWSWSNPPHIPEKGQKFTARLTLRRLVSRSNFGLPGSQAHWHVKAYTFKHFQMGQL